MAFELIVALSFVSAGVAEDTMVAYLTSKDGIGRP